jgi:hypothetical protein
MDAPEISTISANSSSVSSDDGTYLRLGDICKCAPFKTLNDFDTLDLIQDSFQSVSTLKRFNLRNLLDPLSHAPCAMFIS